MTVKFDEHAIDAILRSIDQSHLPGAAVGIAIGGVPVYRKGFGLCSMELPVVLGPQTRMRIYSVTKHFTCLACLLLCEEGKASVNDPIGRYLPELNPLTHGVTIKQLMSNTSGLRDACEIRWFFSGIERSVSAQDLLALYREIRDLNFAPGSAWCYNNGGFHILSAIIEKLEERPLQEVFRRRIFDPIGMDDTLLRRVDTDFVKNSATMHHSAAGGGYERKYLPGELVGEGGIVSTVDDMLRWLRHMADPFVGKTETWALMTTSGKLLDGAETGYGLGLIPYRHRGIDTIYHGGGGLGSESQMIRVPGADLDIIILANRKDLGALELVGRILDTCLGIENQEQSLPGPCATGLFRSRVTGRVIELYKEERGRQTALIHGVETWELFSSRSDLLQAIPPRGWNLELELHGNPAHPDGIRYTSCGCSDELVAISAEPGPMSISSPCEYRSTEIGARIFVSEDSDGSKLSTTGHFGSTTYRLQPIGQYLWRATCDGFQGIWGATVAMEPDRETVTLRTSRNWHMRFRRTP